MISRQSSACLVIIYNHSFPSNMEKLDEYYQSRFSSVVHVIPFHLVDDEKVVPVFEISYMFIGHIANAWKALNKIKCDFFVFIGDDLLLNPKIDERNLVYRFNLSPSRAYIHEIFSLEEVESFWRRSAEAITWQPKAKSVQLPDYFPQEAEMRSALELVDKYVPYVSRKSLMRKFVWEKGRNWKSNLSNLRWNTSWNLKFIREKNRKLNYPLVGGYSDLVIIPKDYLRDFSRLCGVFNVLGLHTELAIPTILSYLFQERITTENDLSDKARISWNGEEAIRGQEFDFDLLKLRSSFPADCVYAHPVKLSKWKL